jgi:regulatory protein
MPERPRKRTPKLLDAESLWGYALKSLGARALSGSELRRKLQLKAEQPGDIETVMARLKEYGYINDERFAEHYATVRRDSQGFGQHRVLRDLRQRRVAPTVAQKAVTDAFEGTSETAMIEQFLERKYRNKDLRAFLQERKNLASAFRRLRYAGFGAGPSIAVLKRYASRAEDLEAIEDGVEEA